eukprot:m.84568 g.84568  ORF g.84568 m.84568 type:complete len:310 (+) comp12162_c0_seq1:239-1168(+)
MHERKALRVSVLCVLTVLFGVGNNVTFFEMGQRMPHWPEFLLYFTTMCYTTMYIIGAIISYYVSRRNRQQPILSQSTAKVLAEQQPLLGNIQGSEELESSDFSQDKGLWHYILATEYQKTFAWLGFWLTVNGLFSQFSDPYVNGNLQSVLYQLTLPATGVLAFFMLKERFSLLNLVGSALVLGGCLMVALPPVDYESELIAVGTEHHNGADWVWIIVFALSVIPNGVCAVLQEHLFLRHKHVNPMLLLFWSNLYTLIGYLLSIPLTMLPYLGNHSGKELASSQKDAFLCLVGHSPLPTGCKEVHCVCVC